MRTFKTYLEISERKDGTSRGQIMLGRNGEGAGIYAPIDVESAVNALAAGKVALVKRTRIIGSIRIPTLQSGLIEVDVDEGPVVCTVLAARPIGQTAFANALTRLRTVDGGEVVVGTRGTPTPTVEAE